MSSVVVSTSAALGRPFVFEDEVEPEVGSLQSPCGDSRPRLSGRAKLGSHDCSAAKILPARVVPASQLIIRPAPEMVSTGIPAIDAMTGGLPRGCLTEICGPTSSGRTTLLLTALAAATRRGEFCALVDASDALDPQSALAAGIALDRLLWVRCNADCPPKSRPQEKSFQAAFEFAPPESRQSERCLEQVLRATDLLLESGGFGMIVLDLADLPPNSARRIPLTTWFRFRRAVENKPTILLAIEQHPIAGSCSSLLLKLGPPDTGPGAAAQDISLSGAGSGAEGRKKFNRSAERLDLSCPTHAQLLAGMAITAELVHSRVDRKSARSVAFASKTAWAG